MQEKYRKKACPRRMEKSVSPIDRQGVLMDHVACIGPSCAWYDDADEECVLTAISTSLKTIACAPAIHEEG